MINHDFKIKFKKYIDSLPEELYKTYRQFLINSPVKILHEHNLHDYLLNSLNDYESMYDIEDVYVHKEKNEFIKIAEEQTDVYPVKNIIKELTYLFDFPKEFMLFNINKNNFITSDDIESFWKCNIAIIIPDIEDFVDFVDIILRQNGYVCETYDEYIDFTLNSIGYKQNTSYEIIYGHKWLKMFYKPLKKETIRESLNSIEKYIRFIYPDCYDDYIKTNGFKPEDCGIKYFVFYDYNRVEVEEMLIDISKQIKQENIQWSGDFIKYIINIKEMPDNINFYYKPDKYNCIRTNQTIYINDSYVIHTEKIHLK